MGNPEIVLTKSERETFAVAQKLAVNMQPGTVVLLHGDLGAGKTAFVRGLAAGLDIDPAEVSSPTFVLVQQYRGRVSLTHVDLYRLDSAAAVDDLGLEEIGSEGVIAVEWADRLPRPIEGSVWVRIEDAGGDTRRITIARNLEPEPIPSDNSALLS